MADALFTTSYNVEGNDTQLSFYKHDTVTHSYYCVICMTYGAINGTYTMNADEQGNWHFTDEVPAELKEAEHEISDNIHANEHSSAA